MTSEERKQRNETGVKKNNYNNFSPLKNEIIKVQQSPLMKIGLGYNGETYQTEKSSVMTGSYLNAAKTSQQSFSAQQKNKGIKKLNHVHSNPRMNNNRSTSQKVNNTKRFYDQKNFFFNGHCFSCHNVGHKAAQCVAYKTIMTREARKQRNETGVKKKSYNIFSPLIDEIEFSFHNNFGHEKRECRSKLQPTSQKEQISTNSKVWKRNELQSKSYGITLFAKGQENQWC